MQKTLRESLVDYDMALLRALAELRGAELNSNHRLTAAEELATQLIAPASLAIALADLSPAETEALAMLQAGNGWMEAPRFARRFGTVRAMGPGRLERERPWLSPANPAEGLWYRGLIFKGFRQTRSGVVEVVYIPDDLLAMLPDLSASLPARSQPATLAVQPTAPPPQVQAASADIVEDVFGVLVCVRNRDIRLKPDGSLSPHDLQAIQALCVRPGAGGPGSWPAGEEQRLAFVIHLPQAAGLVTNQAGRLGLDAGPARSWLRASPTHQLLALQQAWQDDPGWNDLWHVPTLKPQPTGWKNDPVLARRRVLEFLTHCRPDEWYRLADLTQAVKASQPDFQRPDGDYTAWYIHDLAGQPLMGFEHWEEVEGALLRYLVTGPLHWLGAVDLGFEGDAGQPIAFRLAASGLAWLGMAPLPEAEEEPDAVAPRLDIGDDLSLHLPADASLYTRFQIARFAEFVGREAGRVCYRISPRSLARARQAGVTAGQISAFLARASGGRAPHTALNAALQKVSQRSGSARLESGVVLRVDRAETLATLRQEPGIAPLLGEVLGPRAALIPRANLEQVRRWLLEHGYLGE
ncbi:MAG: hypothetical protein Kow0063_15820 [Anaerolineae bacterium]